MKKRLITVVVTLLTGAGIVLWFFSYRNQQMNRLHAEAKGERPSNLFGSVEAVEKLAEYSGTRTTRMLIDIARNEQLLSSDPQFAAMKALRERNEPQVIEFFATLLQPHQFIGTRREAAEALQNLPCNKECIEAVLHYLNREYLGEPLAEDAWESSRAGPEAMAQLRKNQDALREDLYALLQRETGQTYRSLYYTYGVGSEHPSLFGLDLISRLKFSSACSLLLRSEGAVPRVVTEGTRGAEEKHNFTELYVLTLLKSRCSRASDKPKRRVSTRRFFQAISRFTCGPAVELR